MNTSASAAYASYGKRS